MSIEVVEARYTEAAFSIQTIKEKSYSIEEIIAIIKKYYPGLESALLACLAVCGSMSLKGRTKPLSLIFEGSSGNGKSATLQMLFPEKGSKAEGYIYRSDRFTPKSFVSHAANVSKEELDSIDMLPKIQNKILVTKELAPLFRGRVEDLKENISILISVLDGKGFTSDSGMRGRRGYLNTILFNWLGATTPLPASTHRIMSQLGTRLLFFEIDSVELTDDELLAYAERDDVGEAEIICNDAVNKFPLSYFERNEVETIERDSIVFSKEYLRQLVRWARLIVEGRKEVKFDADSDLPIAAVQAEGAWKVIDYLKDLARGHALIHGRTEIDDSDLELLGHIAISSIPGHLRPIVKELRVMDSVDSTQCENLCRVSRPTARKYMKELDVLGIATMIQGRRETNDSHIIGLADNYSWLKEKPENEMGCVVKE
jgi:hypothetical protein